METRPTNTPPQDPYAPVPPPPRAPYAPGPPPPRDNRTLLIAGVIVPLVILTAVISYYLLVAVPDREARERDEVAVVGDEQAPETVVIDEGDGFDASVVDIDAPEMSAEDAGEGGEYGLEGAPRRGPRPLTPEEAARNEIPGFGVAASSQVQAFARRYLKMREGSASDLLRLYRTPMSYYDMAETEDGKTYGSSILQSNQATNRDFPNRRYEMAGPATTVDPEGPGEMVRFDYTFSYSGGPGGTRSGRAWAELNYVPEGNSFVIIGENGGEY